MKTEADIKSYIKFKLSCAKKMDDEIPDMMTTYQAVTHGYLLGVTKALTDFAEWLDSK